jgi:serine/threonine protein phosphatase PrpC
VSGTPDIEVIEGDWKNDKCIIVATDGFWDVFSSKDAVRFVDDVRLSRRIKRASVNHPFVGNSCRY